MGVRVVEAETSDSSNESCSTCCSGSSSSSNSSAKKQTKNLQLKPEDWYYYDEDKAISLHPTAATSSSNSSSSSSSSSSPTSSSSAAQPTYQQCARDLVGNCKEFRIEVNRHNLRIIGNGNRVRIANNTGNLQVIGNNTRLKIIQNSGELRYTGNDGRIYLGSDSQQQSVNYIGCNGILKVVNSTELQNKSKPSKSSCDLKPKSAAKNRSTCEVLPKFKSASFNGATCCGGVPTWGAGAAVAAGAPQLCGSIQQSIFVGNGNCVSLEQNATSRLHASSMHLLNIDNNKVGASTLPQAHVTHTGKVTSGSPGDYAAATSMPQRPPYSSASLPNISQNANCAQFSNKENRFEIRNNLTVVNTVGGNIVIKNAINVGI